MGGVATEVAGLKTDYFAFRDINPVFDYYTPVVISNNHFLSEHPDTAKAFLGALKKDTKMPSPIPKKQLKSCFPQLRNLIRN